MIDTKSLEEVCSKHCRDAQLVDKREKTDKPSVIVASLSVRLCRLAENRPKAEAFAKLVGGEVGEPHR